MRLCFVALFLCLGAIDASAATFPNETTRLEDLGVTEDSPVDDQGNIRVGDMLFRKGKGEIDTKAAVVFERWTNGRFVFQFSNEVTADQRARFRAACEAWISNSSLTCVERTNQVDYAYVRTHYGDQCGGSSCSLVGKVGKAQNLWILADHWADDSVLQHEIGHALGLLHEHQRPDRDNYVLIIEANIIPDYKDQFYKYSDRLSVATDYDFNSIMHYWNCADSKYRRDCTLATDQYHTIQAQSCSIDAVGGRQITELDHQGIRAAYTPDLVALYARSRNDRCEPVTYNQEQWRAICEDGSCSLSEPVQWKKLYIQYHKACGFIPVGKDRALCAEIKREFITSWTDADPASCGRLGLDTLNELWSKCGCSYVAGRSICADHNAYTFSNYENSIGQANWKQGRTIHFLRYHKGT
jgi:hypothetical protein